MRNEYFVYDGDLRLNSFFTESEAKAFIQECQLEDRQEQDFSHCYSIKQRKEK